MYACLVCQDYDEVSYLLSWISNSLNPVLKPDNFVCFYNTRKYMNEVSYFFVCKFCSDFEIIQYHGNVIWHVQVFQNYIVFV